MAKPKAAANGGEHTVSLQALDTVAAAVSQAAARGQDIYEASVTAWTREADRFFSDMNRDGSTALDQLKGCKSPVDVLGVEQAWMMARSRAYAEAGTRFLQAAMAGLQPGGEAGARPGRPD